MGRRTYLRGVDFWERVRQRWRLLKGCRRKLLEDNRSSRIRRKKKAPNRIRRRTIEAQASLGPLTRRSMSRTQILSSRLRLTREVCRLLNTRSESRTNACNKGDGRAKSRSAKWQSQTRLPA